MNRNFLRTRFKIVPGQEAITYTQQNPQQAGFPVGGARYQGAPNSADFESMGVTATTGWALWLLPDLNMAGVQPSPGDTITPGAASVSPGTWTISNSILPKLINSDWRVLCQLEQ